MLANSGHGTRSTVTKLIRGGHVTVNGTVIKDSGYHVKDDDDVAIDGESVVSKKHLYFIFDKPDEVLTAMEDKRLPNVGDFIPPHLANLKLSPVGRLDYHTTGLLIITNDGELSHRITSPKYKLPKKYLITYKGAPLNKKHVEEAASGMTLYDMDTPTVLSPAILELISDDTACLTLYEGKTHEVRRMISSWGCEVLELRRISIGQIKIPETSVPGTLTELSDELVASLKKDVSL